ncbi:MAG: hypothetical protein WC961_07960 [Anaerovoracaceae bacterium]
MRLSVQCSVLADLLREYEKLSFWTNKTTEITFDTKNFKDIIEYLDSFSSDLTSWRKKKGEL